MNAFIARWQRTSVVIIGDLSLLASLYLAHFIAWHTLRTRHKERVARLKRLRLINGGGQAPAVNRKLLPAGRDEEGLLREAAQSSGFSHRI